MKYLSEYTIKELKEEFISVKAEVPEQYKKLCFNILKRYENTGNISEKQKRVLVNSIYNTDREKYSFTESTSEYSESNRIGEHHTDSIYLNKLLKRKADLENPFKEFEDLVPECFYDKGTGEFTGHYDDF